MKTVLLSICLFCHLLACTQDSTLTKRPVFLSGLATYDFTSNYGISVRTSIPFRTIINQKLDDNFRRNALKDKFVSLEFGSEHRPFVYTSLYANAGIGIRFIKSERHFTEVNFEQGILKTFYDGTVYQEQSDGSIKELTLFGRTYATTGLSYAQNWSITQRSRNALFIQIRPSIWIQYPYNSFVKPHLSLKAGVSYRIRDITVHTRTKSRHTS